VIHSSGLESFSGLKSSSCLTSSFPMDLFDVAFMILCTSPVIGPSEWSNIEDMALLLLLFSLVAVARGRHLLKTLLVLTLYRMRSSLVVLSRVLDDVLPSRKLATLFACFPAVALTLRTHSSHSLALALPLC
jgi:hypothetical protein